MSAAMRLMFCTFVLVQGASCSLFDDISKQNDEYVKIIQAKANDPKQSDCLTVALSKINGECGSMNQNVLTLLAQDLMDCYFESSSTKRKYNCSHFQTAKEQKECVGKMNPDDYVILSHFYTQVPVLCHIFKSALWHRVALNAMDKLVFSARDTENHLIQQNATIQKLLADGAKFTKFLDTAYNKAVDFMQNLEAKVDNVWTKLSYFQSWSLHQLTWLASIFYLAVMLVVTFVVTSWKQAYGSRGYIWATLVGEVMFEQVIVRVLIYVVDLDEETLFGVIWFCRGLAIIISLMIYVWFAWTFSDFNTDLYKKVHELHGYVFHGKLPPKLLKKGRLKVPLDSNLEPKFKRWNRTLTFGGPLKTLAEFENFNQELVDEHCVLDMLKEEMKGRIKEDSLEKQIESTMAMFISTELIWHIEYDRAYNAPIFKDTAMHGLVKALVWSVPEYKESTETEINSVIFNWFLKTRQPSCISSFLF